VPSLVCLIWSGAAARGRKAGQCGILAAGLVAALLYHLLARLSFPHDYAYFHSLNVTQRITFDVAQIARNVSSALHAAGAVDRVVLVLTSLGPFLFLRGIRPSRLLVALWVWMAGYLGVLGITSYQPARYFVAFAVPMLLACALGLSALWERRDIRWVRRWVVLVLVSVVARNAMDVVAYMLAPSYTYVDMARDIRRRVDASDHPDGVLMGDIANTIGLTSGLPSINATWGTRDVGWKLARYDPAFYVALGRDTKTHAAIEADHDLQLLAVYDVFEDYYHGTRVYFYEIDP
jgi:hypothetical protein